jgi:hypothetical protein
MGAPVTGKEYGNPDDGEGKKRKKRSLAGRQTDLET